MARGRPELRSVGMLKQFPGSRCVPPALVHSEPPGHAYSAVYGGRTIFPLDNRLSGDDHTKSLLQRAPGRSFRWLAFLQSGPAADRSVAAGPLAVEVRAGRSGVARPAVRVFQDTGARHALGIHWGTFRLTDEGREAPRDELLEALARAGVDAERFIAAEPGQAFDFSNQGCAGAASGT